MWHSIADEWKVQPASGANVRKIAVVTAADLGWEVQFDLLTSFTSAGGFVRALRWAGHDAKLVISPNEQEMTQNMNQNDIVVVLAHGPGAMAIAGNYCDGKGQAFTGMDLGGIGATRRMPLSIKDSQAPQSRRMRRRLG